MSVFHTHYFPHTLTPRFFSKKILQLKKKIHISVWWKGNESIGLID